MGLWLIYLSTSDAFRITNDYPDWVANWLENRPTKVSGAPEPPVLSEAEQKKAAQKAKNWQRRLDLMGSGLEDLENWLLDGIRQGLATMEGQNYTYWQNISARMVDSKLGGLGNRLKKIPLLLGANTKWPERMLSEFAQLYLAIKGFKNLEQLPPMLQSELLNVVGVNTRKEELANQQGITDDWLVLGMIEGIDENLNFRRTWLRGVKTEKWALILDFSFGDAGYPTAYHTGQAFGGELVFYPSAYPLRALVKAQKSKVSLTEIPGGDLRLDTFFSAYAQALAQNPWLLDFPCFLEGVIPVMQEDQLYLIDPQGHYVEVHRKENSGWKMMAMSGGHPITVFGEWTGEVLIPLSTLVDGRLIAL